MSVAVPAPTPVTTPWGARAGQAHMGRIWRWLPLLVVWLLSATYVGSRLDRGWIPGDEGTLSHAAERVLQGELPHRDFDDVYTGGLARFDAVVFRVLGTRLIALRIAMFAVFLLWIPAVYYIATRFAGPVTAAAVTLLCVVWSIPTYPAAMPSWYNLFLATFGTAALIRFTETRKRRWLVAAGVAGGLSVAVKIVGLYYIAAALLFFVFDEHQVAVAQPQPDRARRDRVYGILVTLASIAFVSGLLYLVRAVPGESRLLHFVLPGVLLVAFLTAAEWRDAPAEPWTRRVRRLSGLVGPFALGLAVPLAVFLYPYIVSGSVSALAHGVLIQPAKRLHFAVLAPPSLRTLLAATPWLLVLVPPSTVDAGTADMPARRGDRLVLVGYALVLAILILAAARGGRPYIGVWLTVYYVVLCTVVAGCLLLARRAQHAQIPDLRREQLWLLLCMTAMCSLVQVPFVNPLYIPYFAPIAILTLLAIVIARPSGPGLRPAIVGAFFFVFGVVCVNPGRVTLWDGVLLPPEAWPRVRLAIPHTGLRSGALTADQYERTVMLLRAHSAPDGFIYAAPDCPELYFLSQLRNPTRTLFDFFDDSAGHDARVLRAIDSLHVTAVAINKRPYFSPPIDAALSSALRARFPDSAVVYSFVVRWRP